MKIYLWLALILLSMVLLELFGPKDLRLWAKKDKTFVLGPKITQTTTVKTLPTAEPGPTVTPTGSPTAKPLSFDDLNKLYGPCTKVSVLMYHHIEPEAEAKAKNQIHLNVTPDSFRTDMEYLKNKGYNTIWPSALVNFFDNGTPIPPKSAMITLDDAYQDNFSQMWPILKEYGFKATIFVPAGLIQNPEYLSWQNIKEMSTGGVYFANHTWSHHSSSGSIETLEKEISLADTQLSENEQNGDKIFAYPYGKPSTGAEKVLSKLGYKIAFTTRHGNIMCKGQRYELPRIQVGNAPLSKSGL